MIKRDKMAEMKKDFVFQTRATLEAKLELDFVGETKEGLAYKTFDGDVVVIRLIAKKEDFDIEEAIQEKQEAVEKAKAKAKEQAEKKAKREAEKKEKETKSK